MKKIITRTGVLLWMLIALPHFGFAQTVWNNACGILQPLSTHLLKPDSTVNGDSVIIIPTVFHILTQGGAENISKSHVQLALQILNQDFNRQNPDTVDIPAAFHPLRGNPKVEFRLARIDPNGNCTDGIDRIYSPLTGAFDNYMQMQPNFSWDHTRYLNIYVVTWIDVYGSPINFGASYIAPFDSGQNAAPNYDALMVGYFVLGNGFNGVPPGNRGHTLSHEMGHNLSLNHVFGSGAGCSDDDDVDDTPLQDYQNFGCPTFPHITCANGPDGDMFNNYMDYSQCVNMFSEGQVNRLRTCLARNEWRNTLWAPENLSSTGVDNTTPVCANTPIADFGYGNYARWLCAGKPVQFYEASTWNPTAYHWKFMGGVPETSTDIFPSVVFADSGLHSVSLIVSNSYGTDTIEKVIRIEPAEVYYSSTDNSMTESFEDPVFNQQLPQWILGGKKWSVTNLAAYSGTNSIRLDSGFKYFSVFFTHIFDLSQIPGPGRTLEFKVACGLSNAGTIAGGLRVTWKRPCTYERWELIGNTEMGVESGALHVGDALLPNELQTASTNSVFIPGSSQWKTITLYIPDTLTGEIQIGFDWGNFIVTNKLKGLYIDDIKLLSGNTGIAENSSGNDLNLFPNPSSDFITFDLGNVVATQAELFIYSSTGVLLKQFSVSHSTQLRIPVDDIGSDGMYFYTVRTNDQQFFAGKFIIQH
ncbi:MAG: T9SS type A sorting domain-containing protein [Chitinophagaceae bacterium]|nr:T9SS type A sorting domain-containing protein [Chitinophagaceae bacterium]